MQAELVMIGTELLLGEIVDTNATYMGKVLAENGINLFQKTTVGDNRDRILRTLDAALDRADVVLTSGGLGPTEDDITRECVAELTGRPLEFREDLFKQLEARFAQFRRPMAENNKKQAYAPRGATAIENPNGTAPGLIVEDNRGVIICMPGVPRELYDMLDDSVIPYVRWKFGLKGLIHSRVLKVAGVGESNVDAAIGDIIVQLDNPKIGLLASADCVRIRISARADTLEDANGLIDPVDAQVRDRLPGLVFGANDDTLEGVVDRLLLERSWRLAIAETHTGGMMSQKFTAIGAASFVGGFVAPAGLFEGQDAKAGALDLAQKTRASLEADAALSLVADPAHGTSRPSTSWAAFICPDRTVDWEINYYRTDDLGQLRTSIVCLEALRRYLTGMTRLVG